MNQSEQINELASALAKAQSALTAADKDGQAVYGKYATIDSVLQAVLPVFNAHGIAVIQRPSATGFQGAELETMLVHTSGQWVTSCIKIPSAKNDAHGFGSAYTYARRYALAAMAGLQQVDDGGAAAQAKAAKEKAVVDKFQKLPKDVQKGFAWLKSQKKPTDDHAWRESVGIILEANQHDPEALRGYLHGQGWAP